MTEFGIGQVGLGVVTVAHRAGYRRYGQPVVAGFDPSPAARERFLADEPDAVVYESLDDLLRDERVGVIDLATPHHRATREPLVAQIAAAGLPMLIQKPLAQSYDEAVELADLVADSGGVAMVNQNMCFTPGSLRLVEEVMARRVIGEPFLAQMTVQFVQDFPDHPWFGKDDRWWTGAFAVHYLGLLQLLFGPPQTVFAVTGHDPRQPGVTSDGFGHFLLRYRSGLSVAVTSTGAYYGTDPIRHGHEKVWVQGPEGLVDWQPASELIVSRRRGEDIARTRIGWPETSGWFPGAFGLTMAHFRQAPAAEREPFCSIQDNLYVMAAVEAIYRSSAHARAISLEQVMGARWDPTYGTGYTHGFADWSPPPAGEVPTW